MEDLKSLRSRLVTLQQKSSQNRLSERNIVEILQKLVEKFDLKIIYCLSGKDYLTPSRLIQEISKEVVQEGRISLLDLPSILNVSIENIENRVAGALSEKVMLVNGQLLSKFYVENLCEEINLALQESGQLSLADLTVKYSLPMGFIKEELEKRVGKGVQGMFMGNNTLVTDMYVVRHLGKLRGTLRASKKPVDLKAFDSSLVVSQVKMLIESSQVDGKLDGNVFTPTVFRETVWSEVRDNFLVNRYVEFEFIKKRLGVLGAVDVHGVCEQLGSGEFFHSSYINPELILETKESIQKQMQNKDYADFFDLGLPSCLDEEDIEQLIIPPTKCHSRFLFTERTITQAISLISPLLNTFTEEVKDSKNKKKDSLSLQTIQNELKKKKFLKASPEFLEGFCDSVYSKANEIISEKRESRGKPSAVVQDNLPQDFNYLYLCNKSLVGISKVFANVKPVQVHLMKTLASNFFSEMVRVQLNHHRIQTSEVKVNDRGKLIQKLPEYLRDIFLKIGEKVSNKDLDGFIQEIMDNKKDIPIITLKAVDKKTERSILHNLKSDTKSKALSLFDSKDYCFAAILGVKLKLIDQGFIFELPSEKWALKLAFEAYSSISTPDVLTSFLQQLVENPQNENIADLSEQVISFISS